MDMETQGQFDLTRYLRLAYARRYVVVAVMALVITAALGASYLLPQMYEAESTVFIERNVIENLVKDIAITPSLEDRLGVLAYSLKSRSLLLKVIDEVDFKVNRSNQAEVERLVSKLQRDTGIKTDTRRGRDGMNLFIVSFRSKDPATARDYVNTLVRRYIDENISEKRQEAYGANRFLGEQIRYFKDKLDAMESEIVNFRKEKGIFVAIDERKVVEEIKTNEEKIEEINVQISELKAREDHIRRQMKEENPYTVAIFGRRADDPGARLMMLQNRLSELMTKYTENFPEVIRVKAEIEMLKSQLDSGQQRERPEGAQGSDNEMTTINPLYQQLREELSRAELEAAGLRTRQGHIRNLVETKKAYLRDIPAEKKKLNDMERERDTYKQIYEELVHRLGQSEVSKQMEVQDKAATFRIVDPAVLPTKPVSPNRVKIILLGIFGGIAGGLGSAIVLEQMDRTVRSVGSLRALEVPVLAVIPRIENPGEQERKKKKDTLIFALAGLYVLCALAAAAMERLHLSVPELGKRIMGLFG
ncbi:MAG: Wzz/FepE/Etk N-terminal domain-containing protein [Thermodesulfovibrionales bacterium]